MEERYTDYTAETISVKLAFKESKNIKHCFRIYSLTLQRKFGSMLFKFALQAILHCELY